MTNKKYAQLKFTNCRDTHKNCIFWQFINVFYQRPEESISI